ncbi:transglycosylase domain-containing protein [Hyphomicrobium sp.]|uniref:transglycosylase domain-containing protein n=1 Tax=Hyphomicrobium sp. TaxID=82 RepID=UPI002E35093C|nr:transglycosylase domain-containing protein [Hyphomicrobium sp.]HEX2840965.1 transglycosylase domain-containing protein [Hyphomicrobium sp.]
MLLLFRLVAYVRELLISIPMRFASLFGEWVAFNPRLGPFRYVALAAAAYFVFAVVLVYAVAPVRGVAGHYLLGEKLRYDAERWLATAIYDRTGAFVGTFDARLDSQRDVNYTDAAIDVGTYTANPDHKSIPVREVPPQFWQCLVHHEDRYLGTWLNPFGIDLAGVLKIPYSSLRRSIALKRPSIGVGGSTLPMQLVRVIYNTPPHSGEGAMTKLSRKFSEWWLAPVVYYELTRGGNASPLKQWTANHIWLAQRTGGAPLQGVEITSRVVFGKDASALSKAEQFVLASAVNKPIILLSGDERLNKVRLDRWRFIVEVRARLCAEALISDEAEKKQVLFELIAMAGGPPDPKVRPKLQAALDRYAPDQARRAEANPVARANALMPAARFGLREEMKELYGFAWREHVRGVTATFDAAANLAFHDKIKAGLAKIDESVRQKINPGFTLDPARVGADLKLPTITVVAANAKGEIVRYYEAGETAPYFGASVARDPATGYYLPSRDPRMIASTGKMIAAIAISNSGRDSTGSLYVDTEAPSHGLDTCAKGGSRYGRRAIVAFACSLNSPLINRAALAGQTRIKTLIDAFGFSMPPSDASGQGTPPSTAAVLGQISGSPRRVHHMSAVILASLIGRGATPVREPTLVKGYDFTNPDERGEKHADVGAPIIPNRLIQRRATPLLRALLSAPLCYTVNGTPMGTLKSLSSWCASRHKGLRLHFAKTGTQVTADPNATVDVWTSGGLQFTNGAAYSYVVVVGTGSGSEPWATKVHAADVAAPLLEILLEDLSRDARENPMRGLLPPKASPRPVASNEGAAVEDAMTRALNLQQLR